MSYWKYLNYIEIIELFLGNSHLIFVDCILHHNCAIVQCPGPTRVPGLDVVISKFTSDSHQSGRSLSTPLSGQGTGYQDNLIMVILMKKPSSRDLDGVIPNVVFTLQLHYSCSYLALIFSTNQNIQLIHSLLIRIEWTTGNGTLMSSSQWPIYDKFPPVLQSLLKKRFFFESSKRALFGLNWKESVSQCIKNNFFVVQQRPQSAKFPLALKY